MSALNNSALIGASGSSGYQISRSVRTRAGSSGYFNRTFASVGNRQKWTWSGWVKKSQQAASQTLFSGGTSTDRFAISFGGGDLFQVSNLVASVPTVNRQTNQVFRDPSAWYHIVVAIDTTQPTASNRIYIGVNGVQVTSFLTSNDLTLNYQTFVNNNVAHNINAVVGGTNYVDGYITETNFIDGQALTPTSFGEFNAITGVWQPKKYAGTYGTNGFYLNFSDNSAATAAAIGKDSSGNGNNWTPNGINLTAGATGYDSMVDTPTPYADGVTGRGNYCTLNPLDKTAATTSVNGNLGSTLPANVAGGIGSTFAISSGKWYCEFVPSSGSNLNVGIVLSNLTQNGANSLFSTGYSYYQFNGNKYINGAATAYGASYVVGDVIGIAIDFTALTITFYKNNVSQGAITIAAGEYKFTAANGSSTVDQACSYNFGQRPFIYTPPTGFKALNTQNLPASTIVNGGKNMNAVTYTATPGTGNTISGFGFQPDFLWTKNRDNVEQHYWQDSVRGFSPSVGVTKVLSSNSTAAETSLTGITCTTTSDGFTVVDSVPASGEFWFTNRTYVAWAWKASNTTAVTNTAGSISSQVSANVSAGFSVVTYTGTGANATVGHGLGVALKFIIVKRIDSGATPWVIWQTSFSIANYIAFDTGPASSGPTVWNSTLPTSSVFSVGANISSNNSGSSHVAYCFAEVAGYSKFGSYTGNGSADGPFVYLGFKPRFVMIKRTDAAGNWQSFDTTRGTYNINTPLLYPNSSSAEVASTIFDFLSNGIKIRSSASADWNANGGTYIYACFAENPFSKSLAQ
jgi:hypothetical protein